MNQTRKDEDCSDFPHARTKKNWTTKLIWLFPVMAAAFVGWIVYQRITAVHSSIHVSFNDAEGLEPGNSALKFRGASIGRVHSIEVTDDQKAVDVEITLQKSSRNIAREGSEFWIVKPEISAGQIRGLRTIVSGSYIGVKPGGGKEQNRFEGLTEAPPVEQRKKSTDFELLSSKLGNLKRGTPVIFRGIQVGEVTSYRLGEKSQLVHIRFAVWQEYTPLVRLNSVGSPGTELEFAL